MCPKTWHRFRLLDKNNMTLKLEKMLMKQLNENSKKELSKKRSLQERGITLIALVVTIIILLILAGVTLNIALSDNGLFSKTKDAADKYKQAQEDEEFEIEKIEYIGEGKDIKEVETISNEEDFKKFRNDVNTGDKSFENTLIKLTDDLDLSGDTWTPIGTKEHPFNGVFNGNGHKIKNLKLGTVNDEYVGVSSRYFIGLFGFNEGIIKNIGIESGSIEETLNFSYVAGMIAGCNMGLIEKCYNESEISCNYLYGFGGIVGSGLTNSKISKCYNKGALNFGSEDKNCRYVGGIAGNVGGENLIEISECYNLGNITSYETQGLGCSVAGICSYAYVNMDSCYNVGNLELIHKKEGTNYTIPGCAGIVASLDRERNGSIVKNCYNVGSVKLNSSGSNTDLLKR